MDDLTIFEDESFYFAFFSLGFAANNVAACLNGGHNASVGAWATDAKLFKLFDERTFGIAGRWFAEVLTSRDGLGDDFVTFFVSWEFIFFKATVNFQKAVKSNNFAFAFEDIFGRRINSDSSLGNFSVGHLRSKCAAANQGVKAALVIALAGSFARDVGWTDRFVSLLGTGAFGVIIANFNVVFTVSVLDKACHTGERLFAKV